MAALTESSWEGNLLGVGSRGERRWGLPWAGQKDAALLIQQGEDLSEDRGPPISSMRLRRAAGLAQEISNLVSSAGGYRAGWQTALVSHVCGGRDVFEGGSAALIHDQRGEGLSRMVQVCWIKMEGERWLCCEVICVIYVCFSEGHKRRHQHITLQVIYTVAFRKFRSHIVIGSLVLHKQFLDFFPPLVFLAFLQRYMIHYHSTGYSTQSSCSYIGCHIILKGQPRWFENVNSVLS